jgi:hypothetical protein
LLVDRIDGHLMILSVVITPGTDLPRLPPNGLGMSRPASQGEYRGKLGIRLAGIGRRSPAPRGGASRSEAEGDPSSC